jgi:hypothetical protein
MFVIAPDQHWYRTTEHPPAEFEYLISVNAQFDLGQILLEHDRIPQVPIVHGQSSLWTAPSAATGSGVISLYVVLSQGV